MYACGGSTIRAAARGAIVTIAFQSWDAISIHMVPVNWLPCKKKPKPEPPNQLHDQLESLRPADTAGSAKTAEPAKAAPFRSRASAGTSAGQRVGLAWRKFFRSLRFSGKLGWGGHRRFKFGFSPLRTHIDIFWGRLESEHVLLELAKTRDKRMMEGEGFEGLGFNMVVF